MDELEMRWAMNHMPPSDDKNVAKARAFHRSFPQYDVTALADLSHMAKYLGLGGLYVKDERWRFGLNAFKVLGASYAMGRFIAQEIGKDISEVNYDFLTSPELEKDFGHATFFTATDGNHGRGVAWAAHRLHQKAVVHMPTMTASESPRRRPPRQSTVSSCRIPHGKGIRTSRPGSCRATAPYPARRLNS